MKKINNRFRSGISELGFAKLIGCAGILTWILGSNFVEQLDGLGVEIIMK